MALRKRGGIWYFRKMINGRLFRESTGFADRKAAERRANEIELDIRAGVHGWKSTIPSFAEWWDVYRKTYAHASATAGPRLVATGGRGAPTRVRDQRTWRSAAQEYVNE